MKRFLICLLILEACSSAFFGSSPRPSLKPDNPFVFFGEELVLTCTFSEKNSSRGYLQQGNDNVAEDLLSRPDDRTLVYRVSNTSQFEGRVGCDGISFTCWHPELTNFGGQILHVDYQPESPRNVDCVYYNGHVAECTWTLAQTFVCPQHLNVTAFIRTSYGSIIDCQSSNDTACMSSEASNLGFVDLVIEIQNRKRLNTTFNFTTTINLDERVKYDPVTDIRVSFVSSRNVNLTWSHSRHPNNTIIRANITAKSGTSFSHPLVGNTTCSQWMTVGGLNPAVQYQVSVDVLPDFGGVWSDPRYADFTMPPDAPDCGPPSTPGAYSQTASCSSTAQIRDVTVFWQELPEEHQNGALMEYILRFLPRGRGQVREVRVAATETKAVLPGLDCSLAYTVRIFAANTKESPNFTEVEIPPSDAVVPVSQLLVRLSSSDVRAQWNSSLTPDRFTIFWCQSVSPCFRAAGQCQCAGPVTWLTVPGNQREAVIPDLTPDRRIPGTFRFGISASVQSGSSGIVWDDCIYQANATLTSPPNQVVVSNNTEEVKVTYAAETCVSATTNTNVYVKAYRIRWCLASNFIDNVCSSGEGSMQVPAAEGGEARLTELQPWQLYMVQVEALTLDNLYGPPSPPQSAMLLPPTGLQEGQVAGLVSGLLLAIIFAGIIIFCVCRCRKMETLEVNIPKELPQQGFVYDNFNYAKTDDDDFPVISQFKDFKNQVSIDSGVGSQTETLSMKDGDKSPLSSPKPDQGYVQADGNPTTPFPALTASFTPPSEHLRNFIVFPVQGHIGPNTTTMQAAEENEAPDSITTGVPGADEGLAATDGPAPVEAAPQQAASQAGRGPPRMPELGAYTSFPQHAAPASPAVEGCGGAPEATNGGEDRDHRPPNRESAEELPGAILETASKREALKEMKEPALPEAGESSSQVVHASPGLSTQGAAIAAVPVGNGHNSQLKGDLVPASSHEEGFSQEAAPLESNTALKAVGDIGYVTYPLLGNAPGVVSQNDNNSSQNTPALGETTSITPPEEVNTNPPVGFLEAPGQTGYIAVSPDNSAAAPLRDVDAMLPAGTAVPVDLPWVPAAATPTMNGSKPGDRQAEADDRQAGPQGEKNGSITLPEGSAVKNGYVTLPEGSAAKNGYVTLPEGSAAKNGYVTLPEGSAVKNGYVTLPEGTAAKNGYVTLPEGSTAKNGYVTLPEGSAVKNGYVTLPEGSAAKNGYVFLPEDSAAKAASQEGNVSLSQTPQGFSAITNGYVSPV